MLAFYDCCRTSIRALPVVSNRGILSAQESDEFARRYWYTHICTHPGNVVDGESPLAKLTIERLNAKKDNSGLINVPRSLEDLAGAETIHCGSNYSIVWQMK